MYRSGGLPLLVLKGLIAGELIEIHFEASVVVGDWVCSTLFENTAGATDDKLAALLQKLRNLLSFHFLPPVMLCDLFHGLEQLVEVGHL